MQATWQALQPMHWLTSISLATWPVCAPRACGAGVVVAERRTMSSDCNAMVRLLCLFDLDQDALGFGRLRIAVADRVGQRVGDVARLHGTDETPVDRHADLVHRLAFDLQRLDPLGHHGHRLDVPAPGADPHPRSEAHTSELQSQRSNTYAVFCLT